jgi:hypothetical protein
MSSSINLPRPASNVIEPPPAGVLPVGASGVGNLIINVASAADTISGWGIRPKERDMQLRLFWPTEYVFASALFTTVAQYTSFGWSLLGPHRSVRLTQEMLASVQLGQGWEALMEPFLTDYFTQDNGAFMEVVRTDDDPRAPVVSLNHLDSGRCERTGRYQEPVIYTDREGARHTLKWHNVIAMSEFPSPIEEAYGVGYCALTRVLRAAQIMRDTGVIKQEKASGRFTRQVHLVGGIQTRIIEDAMMQKQAAADAQGYLRYIQPLIVASLDPTSRISKETIDLASIPEDYDEDKALQAYITLIAMAFGGDYQSYAPLPGAGIGSSVQSKILNMKSRGKGPGLFMKRMERTFNFYGILPRTVTFQYGEQDVAAQMEQTELRRARALEREIRVRSGEITTQVARQIAVDCGDLDESYLEMMRETNATDTIVSEDTVPAELHPENVQQGLPGPLEPPQRSQGGQVAAGPAPANANQRRPHPVDSSQGRTPGGPPERDRRV